MFLGLISPAAGKMSEGQKGHAPEDRHIFVTFLGTGTFLLHLRFCFGDRHIFVAPSLFGDRHIFVAPEAYKNVPVP